MANGTIKWFNPTKGYGFISSDEKRPDVFIHISAVEQAGLKTLTEGQRVSYDLSDNRGKKAAINLQLIK